MSEPAAPPVPPAPPAPEASALAPAPRWWRRRPAAWHRPGFRRLTLAWGFTNLADSALYLMVAVWVKELTGSDSAAATVFVMLGLPALAAPFLGQLADRVSRRRLVVAANLLVALAVGSLLLVDSPRWLWLLYAVMVLYSTVGYLTSAAQAGLLRDLLADEELAAGNGVLSTIDQALRLVSPLLGTGLYVLAGPRAVVVTTAACFLAAAVVLAGLRLRESPPETAAERGSYWQEVSAGVRHLRRTPPLGRVTVVIAVAFAATGMVNAAVFPALEQGMGVAASALGPLVSAQGIGALAAGATAAWAIARWGERVTIMAGTVLLGLGILPALGSSLPALVVGLVAVGFGVTWTVVAFTTLRQRLTPPRLQGRTSAAVNMAVNVPQTAMTATAAALLALVDYRWLVAATVLLVLAAAAGTRQRGWS